jgi:hypothetical protein
LLKVPVIFIDEKVLDVKEYSYHQLTGIKKRTHIYVNIS